MEDEDAHSGGLAVAVAKSVLEPSAAPSADFEPVSSAAELSIFSLVSLGSLRQ